MTSPNSTSQGVASVVDLQQRRAQRETSKAAQMVEGLRSRDRALCEEFWATHAPLVRGLLRRSLGPSTPEIEEYVQDVFMMLFDKIDALEDPERLRSFTVGITLNHARNTLRKRHRWRKRLTFFGMLDKPEAPPETATSPRAREAIAITRLYKELDRLDADNRLAFVLRYVEQMSIGEVADAIECSPATAKRRIKAARDLLIKRAKNDIFLSEYLSASEDRDR